MAEAAVDQRPNRFYCHQCSEEILPKLPEYTCPRCDNGFIEEMTEDLDDGRDNDPSAQFAELFGRAFIDSYRFYSGGNNGQNNGQNSNSENDLNVSEDEDSQNMPQGAGHFVAAIIQQLLTGHPGGALFRTSRLPVNVLNLPNLAMYGEPGDYAWGPGGLDAIITQLMNQLEGSGPPPAMKNDIDALPTIEISNKEVDKNSQCSVCMEDFKLNDSARKLPCNHLYHNDCIVPWLQLHGTCPVCRKTLTGRDTTTDPMAGESSSMRNSQSSN